jgi:hypothetical protein
MTDQKKQAVDSSLSEQQVCDFLRKHSNFFSRHPDLLTEMTLPHDSGEAVSLVERQVALLRERNIDMRHRLSKLLDNARANDVLFDKTRRLLLTLLESANLTQLVDRLHFSLDGDFNIPFSSLILFGGNKQLPCSRAKIVTLQEAQRQAPGLVQSNKPQCGDLPKEYLGFLFGEKAASVGSAAVVPLVYGQCFGLLAVGNNDPHYYRSSMGTLFLSYIAEVLNRLIPRHWPD